jgi:hypothetical protein
MYYRDIISMDVKSVPIRIDLVDGDVTVINNNS